MKSLLQLFMVCMFTVFGGAVDTLAGEAETPTSASFRIYASGKSANVTLDVTITPKSNEKPDYYYIVAVLKPSDTILFNTGKGWRVWSTGALVPYPVNLAAPYSNGFSFKVLSAANLANYVGTEFYAGYSVGKSLTLRSIYTID